MKKIIPTIITLIALFIIPSCSTAPQNITITIDIKKSTIKINEPDYYFCEVHTRCGRNCSKDYYYKGGDKISSISLFDNNKCDLSEMLRSDSGLSQRLYIVNAVTKSLTDSKGITYFVQLTPADTNKRSIICKPFY